MLFTLRKRTTKLHKKFLLNDKMDVSGQTQSEFIIIVNYILPIMESNICYIDYEIWQHWHGYQKLPNILQSLTSIILPVLIIWFK